MDLNLFACLERPRKIRISSICLRLLVTVAWWTRVFFLVRALNICADQSQITLSHWEWYHQTELRPVANETRQSRKPHPATTQPMHCNWYPLVAPKQVSFNSMVLAGYQQLICLQDFHQDLSGKPPHISRNLKNPEDCQRSWGSDSKAVFISVLVRNGWNLHSHKLWQSAQLGALQLVHNVIFLGSRLSNNKLHSTITDLPKGCT